MIKRALRRLLRPLSRPFYARVNLAIQHSMTDVDMRFTTVSEELHHHGAEIWLHKEAVAALRNDVDAFMRYVPGLLNTISSQNSSLRQLRRAELAYERRAAQFEDSLTALSDSVAQATAKLDSLEMRVEAVSEGVQGVRRFEDTVSMLHESSESLQGSLGQLRADLGRVEQRLEFVRREVMFEARYGGKSPGTAPDVSPAIVNPAKLANAEQIRLNLGCGHLPLADYLNVDARELDGVDIVSDVGALPFEPGTVHHIHSAHLLEHFPLEHLRRRLLPYWFSLIRPGGTFTAIVPDAEAMIEAYATGSMSFSDLRTVTFGEQEYDGDFHFTMFSREHLTELLAEAGFDDVIVKECARRNGLCLEMEIQACRPADDAPTS